MSNTKKILISLAVLGVVFTAGRYSKPTKVETKIETKTVTVKEEAKTRIVYRDRIIQKDGTIIEKEVEREDTNTKESSSSVAKSESTVKNDSGLTLAALAVTDLNDKHKAPEYELVASKRIIGALNIAASISSEKRIGVGIGWSF